MKSILRASAYHRTVGFVEPPVQGLQFCFGFTPLVASYDMQGIQWVDSKPRTRGGGASHGHVRQHTQAHTETNGTDQHN